MLDTSRPECGQYFASYRHKPDPSKAMGFADWLQEQTDCSLEDLCRWIVGCPERDLAALTELLAAWEAGHGRQQRAARLRDLRSRFGTWFALLFPSTQGPRRVLLALFDDVRLTVKASFEDAPILPLDATATWLLAHGIRPGYPLTAIPHDSPRGCGLTVTQLVPPIELLPPRPFVPGPFSPEVADLLHLEEARDAVASIAEALRVALGHPPPTPGKEP